MTTFDNAPASETPDFTCPVGNTCAGCGSSKNLCHVTQVLDTETACCSGCSHTEATGSRLISYPVAYYGD